MPLEPSTTPSHVLTVSQQNYGLTVEENNWDLTLAYAAISIESNSITSSTTSDGTANLSISNVTTATATVSGLLTAGHIHGNLAGTLYTHVRTGEAMNKGDPFYISGFHVGSSQPIVSRADAADAAKMPAVGVMDADYANHTSGANGIISGTLSSINTNGYAVNSPIYVKDGGGYSDVAGTIPQQVGITERANANTGAFIVTNSKVISFADVSDAQAGTGQIMLDTLAVGICNILDEVVFDTLTYTFAEGSAQALVDALDISFADVSDAETGTATLNLAGATIYPNGSITYASSNSGGAVALSGQLATDFRNVKLPNASGNLALVASTTGQISFADIFDVGAGTADLSIDDLTANDITATGFLDLGDFTVNASTGEVIFGSAAIVDFQAGSTISFNSISYTYGTGAAAAHRTALGLTTLATTTAGTNVANFLEFPTSANLASALTDETGSGSLVFANTPTLTSPTLNDATFNRASIADIVRQRASEASENRIACVHFEDFFGTNSLTSLDTNNNNNFSVPEANYPLAFGVIRMNTLATLDSRAGGKIHLQVPNAVGIEYAYGFSIANINDIEFYAGSGYGTTYIGLAYISGENSNRFVLRSTSPAAPFLIELGTHTVQAGSYNTGTRYQVYIRYNSATQVSVTIQRAAHNVTTWTTIYDSVVTIPSGTVPTFERCSPLIGLRTLTSTAKQVNCDWMSVYHSGILR